ncbi:peptidoglycan/LPS O-acetylase OafA/YrhL [Arthrobacter sp. PvP023]|nr:peptidoglycan/LPS O-acetylase OafA/YrhL [Arthrobacter sp. PvP023]
MSTSDGTKHARSVDLPRLTSLRSFAALAVFGFHIFRWTEWDEAKAIAGHGYAGVAFFFILSGFLLTWSFRPEPVTFYFRRFARLYPGYFMMIIVA